MDIAEDRAWSVFRNQGVLTAREMANALGVSQPTVSRLISSRQGVRRILRIGGHGQQTDRWRQNSGWLHALPPRIRAVMIAQRP